MFYGLFLTNLVKRINTQDKNREKHLTKQKFLKFDTTKLLILELKHRIYDYRVQMPLLNFSM